MTSFAGHLNEWLERFVENNVSEEITIELVKSTHDEFLLNIAGSDVLFQRLNNGYKIVADTSDDVFIDTVLNHLNEKITKMTSEQRINPSYILDNLQESLISTWNAYEKEANDIESKDENYVYEEDENDDEITNECNLDNRHISTSKIAFLKKKWIEKEEEILNQNEKPDALSLPGILGKRKAVKDDNIFSMNGSSHVLMNDTVVYHSLENCLKKVLFGKWRVRAMEESICRYNPRFNREETNELATSNFLSKKIKNRLCWTL